jgi:hypothetical protein
MVEHSILAVRCSRSDYPIPQFFPQVFSKLDHRQTPATAQQLTPADSMFFDNPMLFDLATQELLRRLAHKITFPQRW